MPIKITKDGPYVVSGGIALAREEIVGDANGNSVEWRTVAPLGGGENYALCRCGQSSNKPFCDGTHKKVGFDGTETADRAPYLEQAEFREGPTLSLSDARPLCAFARFCDPNGGVWRQVGKTDELQVAETFVRQVNNCPSGRLMAWQADGKAVEQDRRQCIAVVEDVPERCSGPLWVQGGIELEGADGFAYEPRNRMTLCRCGQSSNKPFCDGTHAKIGFKDENA
jgi:CDGSH-type Zn-finger protein